MKLKLQVALRVLEILICYLLAVVATTPLRQYGANQVMLYYLLLLWLFTAVYGFWKPSFYFFFSFPHFSSNIIFRGPCSSCSPLLCCNGEGSCGKCGGLGGGEGGDNLPAHHLDEEIYTEICQNNHAVRYT